MCAVLAWRLLRAFLTPLKTEISLQFGFEVEDFSSSNYDDPIATPEPGSLALLGSGLIGIGGVIRRKLF